MLNSKVNNGINKQEKVIETLNDVKRDSDADDKRLLNKLVVDEEPKIDEFKGVESKIKAFDKKVDPLGDLMDKRKDKEHEKEKNIEKEKANDNNEKIDKIKDKDVDEDWKEE